MFRLTFLGDRNSSSLVRSKDDVTRLRTITLKVGECLSIKDDENNQITSVCLSVQKGVVGDAIENFKMFVSG